VLPANIWTNNGNGLGYYGICTKEDMYNTKRKTSSTAKKVQKRDKDGNVVGC